MRFQSVSLQWFRGAAESADLQLSGRSGVVYGVNGAGKSSFVDAIEVLLNAGRIGHLSHEYSGRHQERGIINAFRPADKRSRVEITLVDGSSNAAIWHSSAPTLRDTGATAVEQWDYRRTVLRQEELANFIKSTKGEKYSAILPLLGLSELEASADNLHRLAKAIERKGDLSGLRAKLASADDRRR
ncbi:AAA family ATPase [Salinarimonas rosea]|uniref:AAA family ATPase n=1 Tax=Salinarimonas rosea TaxID=552063 RepID=UPI0012EC51DE